MEKKGNLFDLFKTKNMVRKYTVLLSCAKNHDIERRRAVVKLPRAREKRERRRYSM